MERTAAILVDAGYVWKQIAKAVGLQHRSETALRGFGVPLIEALVEEAEGDDLAVLRTYWYDAAGDSGPNVQQRVVGRTPRVKLRLGTLSRGRQKGVDRLIQKDILALATNKAVTDIVVVSGDQDMEEEVDAAGQHGVLMHVWGISGQDQQHSISGRLLRIADEWRIFAPDWAETFVWSSPPSRENDQPVGAAPLASDSALAALRAELLGVDAQTEDLDPGLERLTTEQQFFDTGRAAYDSLKEQHSAAWHQVRDEIAAGMRSAADGKMHRNIPSRYDTELMDTVEAIVGGKIRSQSARAQIRNGFWAQLDGDSAPAE